VKGEIVGMLGFGIRKKGGRKVLGKGGETKSGLGQQPKLREYLRLRKKGVSRRRKFTGGSERHTETC